MKNVEKDIQYEAVSTLIVAHVSSERTHTAHCAKRRSEREELVLWKMGWEAVDVDVRSLR